jgi:hypothetical protein
MENLEPQESVNYPDSAEVVARPGEAGLRPLERLGALAIRFLHQLTNDMTCMTSGLNLMEETLKDSGAPGREEILEQTAFLDQAYQRLNATVSEFASVRRSLRFNDLHPEIAGTEVAARLRPVLEQCGFGALSAPGELGRVRLDVSWLEECLLLARQVLGADPGASGAEAGLASYERIKPLVGARFGLSAPTQCLYLSLPLGPGAAALKAELKLPKTLAGLLLNELLRQMRGVLVFEPQEEGRAAFYFPAV